MGLIKSKSPVSGQAVSTDDSTQNASVEYRRCPRRRRRRLPPTPSPWTSGELVDSSPPENQAELISALRSKWSEVAGQRSFGQRRSMPRKLMGRLSQKINPHVHTTQHVPATSGRCDADATSSLVSASTDRVHDANNHYQLGGPACVHHHCAPRTTTLSIYRSTLQSCSDDITTNNNNNNNNNADKPVETVYQKSNQVCISRNESLIITARLLIRSLLRWSDDLVGPSWRQYITFYSASALPAIQSAVLARGISSVRPYVACRYCVQTNEDTIVRFSASGRTFSLDSGEVKFIYLFI